MGEMIKSLFGDPADVTAWSTVILAIVTAMLAALTGWLAAEQRKTRRDANAPDVVVSIEPAHATILKVRVSNIGRGLARDVKIVSKPPMTAESDRNGRIDLATTKLFSPSFLRPGQVLERWLGQFFYFEKSQFTITVLFYDTRGYQYKHVYEIDVSMLDRTLIDPLPLEVVAKEIKRIADKVDQFSSGFARLNTNTYSSADRETEAAERRAELDQLRANPGQNG